MIKVIGITEEHKLEIHTENINEINFSNYKWFWADFHEPTDKEIEHLSTTFHFHPLAIEDCVQRLHRPKLDYYENHTFYVTHSVLKESSELIKNELNFSWGQILSLVFIVCLLWKFHKCGIGCVVQITLKNGIHITFFIKY